MKRPLVTTNLDKVSGTELTGRDWSTDFAKLHDIGDPGYTTPTHTNPTIGAATTAVLAATANRLYALLENDSDETIYLKFGANAVMNQGIRLNAQGGSYEMSKKLGNLYVGAINGICASGGKVLLVTEGV